MPGTDAQEQRAGGKGDVGEHEQNGPRDPHGVPGDVVGDVPLGNRAILVGGRVKLAPIWSCWRAHKRGAPADSRSSP